MRLCMFHPVGHPMERGWVGRIDGERVVHLAAQTLQSFFTGGGSAREHAVYRRQAVRLLAPVLHPPAVRVFESQDEFAFANPAAIVGPDAAVAAPVPDEPLAVLPRLAAVVGADEELAGFTVFTEWRAPGRPRPKDRDFALGLGPVVLTTGEHSGDGLDVLVRVGREERLRGRFAGFDWAAARALAGEGTALRPGDLLAGPALEPVTGIAAGSTCVVEVDGIGALAQRVLRG